MSAIDVDRYHDRFVEKMGDVLDLGLGLDNDDESSYTNGKSLASPSPSGISNRNSSSKKAERAAFERSNSANSSASGILGRYSDSDL